MPTKTIYVPDADLPYWEEAALISKRHNRSLSKIILDNLKTMVRERQGDTGVPLGVPIPASMKDPELLAREQMADTLAEEVRTRAMQFFDELGKGAKS